MNKKYQIFISSTYEDLKEERRIVQDTILSMYQFPIGMEMFSASNEEQWEIIKETIDSSDYYILIIGYRYGSLIEEGEDAGISYTQKEFRYAVSKSIPILAFLVDEKVVAVTLDKMEQDSDKKLKLEEFKKEIVKGRSIQWWKNPQDLANKVMNSLNKQIEQGKRLGWTRETVSNEQKYDKKSSSISQYGIKQIKLETLIKQAKKEIYIFGNTLTSLYNEKDNILNLLDKGAEVKLLTMDLLDSSTYERNCDYLAADITRMKKSSELGFSRLKEIKKEYLGNKLQIKATPFPIAIGIVATDIEEDGMIVATHLLPTLELSKNCLITKICKDSVFYERYKVYIKRFWNENIQEVNQEYFDKLEQRENKHNKSMTKNNKIFLSYCWDDDKIANGIYEYFKKNIGVELYRDKINIKTFGSIKSYMQSIVDMEYTILLISDSYLKSSNCMYEVLEVMKDRNYRNKIFPAVISNRIYNPIERAKYVKYWKDEFNKLHIELQGIEPHEMGRLGEDLKRYQNIASNVAEFLDVISDMNNPDIININIAITNKLNEKGLLNIL